MGIQFRTDEMPTKEMILDEASVAGIYLEPESLAELHFLDFCRTLWLHGNLLGIKQLADKLREKRVSESEAN